MGEVEEKIESLTAVVTASAKANESFRPAGAAAPAKRGRGRPRRGGEPNKATLELLGLEDDPLNPQSPPSGSSPDNDGAAGASAGADPGGAVPPPFDIPPVVLATVLEIPFKIARAKTGSDRFQLDKETNEACAPLANEVFRKYFPEALQSEHAPLIMLLGTLGIAFGTQYMMFLEDKQQEAAAIRAEYRKAENVEQNQRFAT